MRPAETLPTLQRSSLPEFAAQPSWGCRSRTLLSERCQTRGLSRSLRWMALYICTRMRSATALTTSAPS